MTRRSIAVLFLLLLSPFAHADAPPDAPAGDELPRFVLVLEPGPGDAPELSAYGATKVDQWYDRIFIRISDEQARELSKHPRVRYVQRLLEAGERNTFVSAPQHERGPRGGIAADAVTAPAWSSGNYSYDGAGSVIGIGSDTYVYDAVGRLKRATLTGTSTYETYTYDAFGNLNQRNRTSGSATTTYASPASGTSNRLSGAAYDTAGNFVSGSGSLYGYEWDSFRMIARQTGSGRNDYYVYDANDERIGSLSVPAGSWKWTIRDAGGQVLREYESQNVAGADWIWAEDFVYDGRGAVGSEREQAEGGRRHFHRDHLGSVRMVTNHAGQAISRHDYAPFGQEVTAIDQEADRGYSRPTTKAFTGHERDYSSGTATPNTDYLDYMHARYYSPNWGRFLSVDPGPYDLRQPRVWNRYAYVGNNPMIRTDPTGRCWWDLCIVETAVVTAVAAKVVTGTLIVAGVAYGVYKNVFDNQAPSSVALSEGPNKTLDDLLADARPFKVKGGPSTILELDGGYEDAVNDFEDIIVPGSAVPKPDGLIVGVLPDGRTVVVRDHSSDGAPTLEVQEGRKRIKVRYRDKKEEEDDEEPKPKEEQ